MYEYLFGESIWGSLILCIIWCSFILSGAYILGKFDKILPKCMRSDRLDEFMTRGRQTGSDSIDPEDIEEYFSPEDAEEYFASQDVAKGTDQQEDELEQPAFLYCEPPQPQDNHEQPTITYIHPTQDDPEQLPLKYIPPSQPVYVPRCPVCGSPNINKILAGRMIVDTILVGPLYAHLNSKTWKCCNCGHEF